MSATKFKSSFTPVHPANKIDPDAWVTSKDKSISLQGYEHDGRWIEQVLWIASGQYGQFVITIYDKQTNKSVTEVDNYKTTAFNRAKAQIGMP